MGDAQAACPHDAAQSLPPPPSFREVISSSSTPGLPPAAAFFAGPVAVAADREKRSRGDDDGGLLDRLSFDTRSGLSRAVEPPRAPGAEEDTDTPGATPETFERALAGEEMVAVRGGAEEPVDMILDQPTPTLGTRTLACAQAPALGRGSFRSREALDREVRDQPPQLQASLDRFTSFFAMPPPTDVAAP